MVDPVLSYDKCVLLKNHNAETQMRLEPAASRSRIKHSTMEPLRSLRCSSNSCSNSSNSSSSGGGNDCSSSCSRVVVVVVVILQQRLLL